LDAVKRGSWEFCGVSVLLGYGGLKKFWVVAKVLLGSCKCLCSCQGVLSGCLGISRVSWLIAWVLMVVAMMLL